MSDARASTVTTQLMFEGKAEEAMSLYISLFNGSVTSIERYGPGGPGAEGSVTAGLQLSDTLGTALGTGIAGAIIAAIVRSGFSQGVGIGAAFAVAAAVGLAGAVLSPRLRGALARPAGRPVQTDELDLIA